MNKKEFIEELKQINVNINEDQLIKLDQFFKLLIEWNKKINLTTIILEEDVYLKHFYDSLTIIKAIDLDSINSLCDVGTGAGFPGLVIAIIYPNLEITLVDSLQKRINYLNEVIKTLELPNVKTFHNRGEEYARKNREKFDIVTVRAVAHLRIISEICIPMVKVEGLFIPLKGNISEEIKESESTLRKLDSKIIEIVNFQLPKNSGNRNILKIIKLKQTKELYPRTFDKIQKKSL